MTLGFATEQEATTAAWQADVILEAGADAAPGLVTELAWQGVPVTRLEVASATLDDVFLELTGRSLRERNETAHHTVSDTESDTESEGAAA